MGGQRTPLVLVLVIALLRCTFASESPPFKLPTLTYAFNAIEPNIDDETMFLHYSRHHNASVTALNKAVSERPQDFGWKKLHELLQHITDVPGDQVVRNHGGSHFNHMMYWSTLRPTYAKAHPPAHHLRKKINAVWGDFNNFTAAFTAETSKVFGSGWVWLVYKRESKSLAIVRTPNQDNPLMRNIVPEASRGTPILGIDLWEHAFYLKHRNVRANYVPLWWQVVDWKRVSANYLNAKHHYLKKLVGQ